MLKSFYPVEERACVTACRNLPAKIGDVLTPEQYKQVQELGLLVDKDDQVNFFSPCKHCCHFFCLILSGDSCSDWEPLLG